MAMVMVVGAAAGVSAGQAGGVDMAAIQKWNAAKVVRYQITGSFKGTTAIARGQNASVAQATVTDGVTIDLQLDMRTLTMVGAPKIGNSVSATTGLSSGPAQCSPPAAKGPYEHVEVASVVSQRAALELKGTRTLPAVDVSSQWPSTCDKQPQAGGTDPVSVHLALPSPVMLSLPANADPKFTVSADRWSRSAGSRARSSAGSTTNSRRSCARADRRPQGSDEPSVPELPQVMIGVEVAPPQPRRG